MNIGLLALQGGYAAHAAVLQKLNVEQMFIRTPQELAHTDGLILPGGESSVLIKLLQQNGLWTALTRYQNPIFGTCAGAILLAKEVSLPSQLTLNRIAIHIERNAYGRQLASHIATGTCLLSQRDMEMVFIRAPKITALDKQRVKILATCRDGATAVQSGNCMAATFHPELSPGSTILHTYFLQLIAQSLASR